MSNLYRHADLYPLILLKYIRQNGITNRFVLAEYLGIHERTVRRVMKSLVLAGYPVKSKSGPYGGYFLEEPQLTENDWIVLKDILAKYPELYEKIEYRLMNI